MKGQFYLPSAAATVKARRQSFAKIDMLLRVDLDGNCGSLLIFACYKCKIWWKRCWGDKGRLARLFDNICQPQQFITEMAKRDEFFDHSNFRFSVCILSIIIFPLIDDILHRIFVQQRDSVFFTLAPISSVNRSFSQAEMVYNLSFHSSHLTTHPRKHKNGQK